MESTKVLGTSRSPKINELTEEVIRQGRRRIQRDRVTKVLAPVGVVLLALVLWQAAVVVFELPKYLLPAPTDVILDIFENGAVIWEHSLVTLNEVVIGYAIAVVVGLGFGVLLSQSKFAEQALYPLIVATQAMPKSALAPLFLIWFGFGIEPKVAVVFLISFFPIVVAAAIGLTSVEEEKRHLAALSGLNRRQTFMKISLPQALPSIFGGLRIGVTLAVVGAIVGEFVGATEGLGYLLIVGANSLNTARVFSVLIALTVMGIVLFAAMSAIEDLAIPWHVSKRRQLPSAGQ